MRTLLFSAVAIMALSACNADERADPGRHADATTQPAPTNTAPADAPARNVPGGGSGTAAAEQQDSGNAAGARDQPAPEPPPKH